VTATIPVLEAATALALLLLGVSASSADSRLGRVRRLLDVLLVDVRPWQLGHTLPNQLTFAVTSLWPRYPIKSSIGPHVRSYRSKN
jgi:hypothetical protein